MRVVLLENDQVLKDLKIDAESVTIGSEAASQVHLPDLAVGLEHARLIRNPTGQWMVELAHQNGALQVNGRQVDQRCPIFNADEIAIEQFTLKIAVDEGTDLGVAGRSSLDELAEIKNHPLPPGSEVRRPQQPLSISQEQFASLARFAEQVASCDGIGALTELTLATVLDLLDAQMAWYGLRPQPMGRLETVEGRIERSATSRPPQAVDSLEYRCLERSQSILIARKKSQDQQSALVVPLTGRRGRFGLLYAEAKPEEHRYTMHDLDLMLAIAAHAAARLETLLLAGAGMTTLDASPPPSPDAAPKTSLSVTNSAGAAPPNELEQLRSIQVRLNARRAPTWKGYQLAIHWRPGKERGGDLYDAMTLPNGMGSMIVAHIGSDPAGTIVSLAQARAAFRVAGLHGDPPRTLLQELNWLANDIEGHCALSVAHVVFNPKTGALEFGAAGAVEAIIIDVNGQVRTLAEDDGHPLGSARTIEVPRRKERLAQGELLVILSPGYRTLRDPSGTLLKPADLIGVLRSGKGEAPSGLLDDLHQDLAPFFRQGHQPDDMTLLLLRRT